MQNDQIKKGIELFGHEIIRSKRTNAAREQLSRLRGELNDSLTKIGKLTDRQTALRTELSALRAELDQTRRELTASEKRSEEVPELLDLALQASGCKQPSRAQLKQDIFVLLQTKFKTGGYFVEFGATDGLGLSNTYLLEKNFGWTGILSEPAPMWHAALKQNRTAALDFDCVWKTTGDLLDFNMVEDGEFSTVNEFTRSDQHAEVRQSGQVLKVKSVSLNDLLERHNAPRQIDYLSIDTEGSEYEILSNFDFSNHDIQIITCEHNFTKMGDEIFELLSSKGYTRVLENISRWDHWYVRTA
ncbi:MULTISPECIES: FkbM family methyltransferase [unclassified Ruegeria]|uniref:FkbM family methyltransferase n=1 Tax=unclassified Ruegeria TaxID=2625375 RepID=UPI0014895F93